MILQNLRSKKSIFLLINWKYSFFIQNINSKLFPSDFFDPILPQKEKNESLSNNDNNKNNKNRNNIKETKSTYVSLQKEYEEDKELLDLLVSSKRNLYYI